MSNAVKRYISRKSALKANFQFLLQIHLNIYAAQIRIYLHIQTKERLVTRHEDKPIMPGIHDIKT